MTRYLKEYLLLCTFQKENNAKKGSLGRVYTEYIEVLHTFPHYFATTPTHTHTKNSISATKCYSSKKKHKAENNISPPPTHTHTRHTHT